MIKEWHQRIHAGDSAYRLAVEANEAGLPTVGRAGNPGHRAAGLPKIAGDRGTNPAKWARPTIVQILRNPIHCGLQTYKGQLARDTENGEYVKGQWEPIIDVKTWETTCALLDNRPVRRGSASNKVKYLLSGLVACGKCDGPLYPKQVRNEATRRAARRRDVPPRLLYTCVNFCTAIDMQYLDRYVEAFLLGTADSDGWLMVLQNRECGEPADLQSEIDKLGSVVRQVEDVALNKRAGLPGGDDDSTYGRLSVEALDRNVMQWALKRNTLIAKQAEANRSSPVDTVTRATWNEAPLDRRRSVISKVLRIKVLPLKTGAGFKPGKVELSLHGEKWSAQAKAIAAIAAEVVQNERRPAKATRDRVYSPRACEYCGTQFMAVSSRGRYCSRRCGYLGLRAERKQEAAVAAALRHLTCAVCGAKFTQRPVGRVALFCSRRCKYEAAEAARKRRAA